MFEAEVNCDECRATHHVCSKVMPRTFAFECPVKKTRVELPYRDPSKMVRPWAEVESCSPNAIRVLRAENRGTFEL